MLPKSLRLLPLLALGAATPAAAQAGGLLSPSGGLIFWTIVTFVVVLVALAKFAWPYILGAVEAREEHIRELLEGAARDRAEAERLLVEQQRELEETRSRVQEALAEGRATAERLRDELLAQARREQAEMIERGHREIAQATERALDTVRDEAVDLAIAAAEKLLAKNLDAEDNRRLVRDFLARVEAPATPAGV